MELIKDSEATRKALGQFFSGSSVASLLITLAAGENVQEVIDPMCGTGDMLLKHAGDTNAPLTVTGIEVDEPVYNEALVRIGQLPHVSLINNNAFNPAVLKQLSPAGYDLVITNPPYVRHQTVNEFRSIYPSALNLTEIRANLIENLKHFNTIDAADRALFETIISKFSGLSDLAVPSWILCSLLVEEGGRLAMVMPETWLSRDYALIIKYILLRWFEIEYIIEDANSCWFLPAQVKTNLIVAKRIRRKATVGQWDTQAFKYCTLYEAAQSAHSLVGNAFSTSDTPEYDFKAAVNLGISRDGFFETRSIPIKKFADDLKAVAAGLKWYKLLEAGPHDATVFKPGIKFSSMLIHWLQNATIDFCSLESAGIAVSQGLRTGANSFFYLNYEPSGSDRIIAMPDKRSGLASFEADKRYFKPVVRKQSELPDAFSLDTFEARGVVLALQSYALPEDIDHICQLNSAFSNSYQEISAALSNYIRNSALLRNGSKPTDKLIPQLSAVAPNARKWNPSKPDLVPRYWYMLPDFTKRHYPELFLPRVNTGVVNTRLNNGGHFIIDANFSSLWINDKTSLHNNYSLLALLNSTWAQIIFEECGTVMGGGALKLEATQIKRMPFPILPSSGIEALTLLGEKLADQYFSDELQLEIDNIFLHSFGFKEGISEKLYELYSIKEKLLNKRL